MFLKRAMRVTASVKAAATSPRLRCPGLDAIRYESCPSAGGSVHTDRVKSPPKR
ncbi:hypothetical protein GGD66_002551 [Bradyrhizobium sp. CIR48]|nr:hypothetical protein [Bradyrhizobium sp. CIR48]